MGIAWLLLKRTFATRPKRTFLFLIGYAVATAVMITLLAVGEAVLLQAQDKDLLGGGDVILVPQGIDIESLKVGGVSAMYYTIPQARFILQQVLSSSRIRGNIETVSPYLFTRLLYARKPGEALPGTVYAEGSLPDEERAVRRVDLPWHNNQEDREWLTPDLQEFYHSIDHFHQPTAEAMDLSRWAEWHYFNFEGGNFYGYLSVMAAGDIFHGNGRWIVSLQLFDGTAARYSATMPAMLNQLPLKVVDYDTGLCRIRFVSDHYEIELNYSDKIPIRGTLRYYPQRNLYFPPAYLSLSRTFESGYVIPSLRGKYEGEITVGSRKYDFSQAEGYHDHNWGIWQQPGGDKLPVSWNWGHAFSPEYALFYGEIFLQQKSKGLFVGVFDHNGFLTLFRPDRIEYSGVRTTAEGLNIPSQLRIAQQKAFTGIEMAGNEKSHVATPAGDDQHLYFIQYKMDFDIHLRIDNRQFHFPARGNAETFVLKEH